MAEWPRASFGDLIAEGALEIGDGYRAKNEELGGTGPVFLRAGLVQDAGIDLSTAERFHSHRVLAVAGKTSRGGDVLVTTKGNSTGRVSYWSHRFPTVVYSPHLSYWRALDPCRLLPGYLRYWSQSRDFAVQLAAMALSTDMAPYLSLSDQRRLVIPIPPIAVQHRIASILGCLDDKIESNRGLALTQRTTARSVFASWLREQRATCTSLGSIAAIADLNPESWTARDRPQLVRYVDLGATSTDRIDAVAEVRGSAVPSRAQRVLRPGDTILGTVRPGNRSYALIHEEGLTGSTGFAQLRPHNRRDAALVYLAATSGENIERLARLADGGAYPAVRPAVVAQAEIPMASIAALEWLSSHAQPLLDRAAVADAEAGTLASIRDVLLPRLLDASVDTGQRLAV